MKLLLTGAWNGAREHISELEALGHEMVFMQNEADGLPCEADWPEGVICNGLFLHHRIEEFTNLRYIQLTSAGYDRVPMDYIERHEIAVHNARGVYSIPMAEFAVGGVLQLYKQSRFFYANQREHKWEKHRGLLELDGKCVLIVGCGSVGTECAKRFGAFGCEVIGIDLYPRGDAHYREIRPLRELDTVLAKADILVLTLPLTQETHHMLNRERLCRMKPGAALVNISRGGVTEEAALVEALQTRLMGAALDVFETEPLDEASPLWNMDNVILTPHNSFVGDGNKERLWKLIYQNLRKENGI